MRIVFLWNSNCNPLKLVRWVSYRDSVSSKMQHMNENNPKSTILYGRLLIIIQQLHLYEGVFKIKLLIVIATSSSSSSSLHILWRHPNKSQLEMSKLKFIRRNGFRCQNIAVYVQSYIKWSVIQTAFSYSSVGGTLYDTIKKKAEREKTSFSFSCSPLTKNRHAVYTQTWRQWQSCFFVCCMNL